VQNKYAVCTTVYIYIIEYIYIYSVYRTKLSTLSVSKIFL